MENVIEKGEDDPDKNTGAKSLPDRLFYCLFDLNSSTLSAVIDVAMLSSHDVNDSMDSGIIL